MISIAIQSSRDATEKENAIYNHEQFVPYQLV